MALRIWHASKEEATSPSSVAPSHTQLSSAYLKEKS